MFLKCRQHNLLIKPTKQRGSMLVIALFVIIVFALLGLTMTRLLSSSSETVIYEVLGQRALNAGRAGIECAVAGEFGAGCENPVSKAFSDVAGLEKCQYSVIKDGPKTITDGGKTFNYFAFTSTGQCREGKINVTRTVYVDAMVTL